MILSLGLALKPLWNLGRFTGNYDAHDQTATTQTTGGLSRFAGRNRDCRIQGSQNDFDKLGKYFSALSNEANLKGKANAWLLFGIENRHRDIIGSNYRGNDRAHLDSLKSEIANKTTSRITFIDIHELENLLTQKNVWSD